MNTSEKKIDCIDFDLVPDLVNSGAKFNCYIINYNISDLVKDYPIDRIIQFIDENSYGDIDYEDYQEYIEDVDKDNLSYKVNEFLNENEDLIGFLIIETENSILVQHMFRTEISDVVWSCFEVLNKLAYKEPTQKVNTYKPVTSTISKFFKVMPLS